MREWVIRSAVVTLVLLGPVACAQPPDPVPSSSPTSAPTPITSPTASAPSVDVSSIPVPPVDELLIPADLSPDQLAQAVVASYSRWGMAGTGPEAVALATSEAVTLDPADLTPGTTNVGDLALLIAHAQTAAHAEALFGPAWEGLISPAKIEELELFNANVVVPYLLTAGTASTPYEQGNELIEITSVEPHDDGSTTFVLRVQPFNNGTESGFGAEIAYAESTWTFTTIPHEGSIILESPIWIA